MNKYLLALGALALCVGVVLMLAAADIPIASGGGAMWRAAPRTSPFEATRWKDSTPQVKVAGTWYELVSMNDISTDQIITWCKQLDPQDFQKRFDEDLPEVMMRMKHDLGDGVTLKVKTLDTSETKTLDHVALTEANRQAIWAARNANLISTTQPANGIRNGYPRLSPFTAVRWRDQTPEVQVRGDTWYELLAINDIPADQIVAFSRSLGASMTEKHFEEDLIELLTRMGHTPGTTTNLKLKDLSTGQEQTMKDVKMTEQNRQNLLKARMEEETKPQR